MKDQAKRASFMRMTDEMAFAICRSRNLLDAETIDQIADSLEKDFLAKFGGKFAKIEFLEKCGLV